MTDLTETLRAFVEAMPEIDHGCGVLERRQDPWWVALTALADTDFNREITPPGADEDHPEGVLRIMVDDDFWAVAVLPYRFSELSIETLVATLWPQVENPRLRPDSGSPEQEEFYRQRQRKMAAYRLASEEREPNCGLSFRPSYESARQIEGTIYEIEVLNPSTLTKETRRVDVEEYFARFRGRTLKFHPAMGKTIMQEEPPGTEPGG